MMTEDDFNQHLIERTIRTRTKDKNNRKALSKIAGVANGMRLVFILKKKKLVFIPKIALNERIKDDVPVLRI